MCFLPELSLISAEPLPCPWLLQPCLVRSLGSEVMQEEHSDGRGTLTPATADKEPRLPVLTISTDQVLAGHRAVTPYLTEACGVRVAITVRRKLGQRGCSNASVASLTLGNI